MAKSDPDKSKSKNNPFEKFYQKKTNVQESDTVPVRKSARPSHTTAKSDAPATSLDSKIQKRLNKLKEADLPQVAEVTMESMRLNKFLAHAGIASRRKADELIAEGKVKVNGEVVKEMGYRVKVSDKITFDDKRITPETKVYILLNKPKEPFRQEDLFVMTAFAPGIPESR